MNWGAICTEMYGTRNRKQVRDRYMHKLRPGVNTDKWSAEEDQKLLELYNIYGNRWRTITKEMPGRTEMMVKNHFYLATTKSVLRKILLIVIQT